LAQCDGLGFHSRAFENRCISRCPLFFFGWSSFIVYGDPFSFRVMISGKKLNTVIKLEITIIVAAINYSHFDVRPKL
jgi:hypothetical protein